MYTAAPTPQPAPDSHFIVASVTLVVALGVGLAVWYFYFRPNDGGDTPTASDTPPPPPPPTWAPQVDKVYYAGYCTTLKSKAAIKDATFEQVSSAPNFFAWSKKPLDITSRFKKAASNSEVKGAPETSIDCFGDFTPCPTNNTYKGSTKWWSDDTVGLGPGYCDYEKDGKKYGEWQGVWGKCKNGNTFKAVWGNPVDVSACMSD